MNNPRKVNAHGRSTGGPAGPPEGLYGSRDHEMFKTITFFRNALFLLLNDHCDDPAGAGAQVARSIKEEIADLYPDRAGFNGEMAGIRRSWRESFLHALIEEMNR